MRVAVIGTGDEGSVLIGAITPGLSSRSSPSADIRPYNVHRAFHGDDTNENTKRGRPGLMTKYGWKTEDEASKNVKVYDDYKDMLNNRRRRGRHHRPAAAPARPGGHRGHGRPASTCSPKS